MASLLSVTLSKGESPSWGFRLQGGKDFGTPLVIQKVVVGSPAERAGLIAGDSVIRVNNTDVFNLRHKDAQDVLLRSGNQFDMTIQRGGSTWKPSVIPTGTISSPTPAINNISPVTRTSLAAKPSENIGAIGTGHNLSAKPFLNGTVNGGPKVVNNQYNTPLKLYSEESIAETLSAQTEVLSTGALGVNFKKNEKNYDASKSAVLSLLKEEEKSPRTVDHTDHHQSSGIDSAPSPVAVAGLRHVTAPENKPQPPSQQLPPGQNICADCERLIVGVFVRIKDKNLHVECFKCSTCGSSLKNVGYYNINNKLYCDIHAKLAARNNPPAPNLIPITISPGSKAPAIAISAALASHPHPTSAPLSPKINSYQNSFSGPKPFGSVSGPLSPSNLNQLQKTEAPLSPVAPISTPIFSPVSAPVHSLSSVVWPPVQEEPEFPSACPHFYPPPSQVDFKFTKHTNSRDSDNLEVEEINSMDLFHSSKMEELSCGYERKSAIECAENLSETIDTQILVENIIKSRPQSPPMTEFRENTQCNSRNKSKEQSTVQNKNYRESRIEMKETHPDSISETLVANPIPKKWESQMLKALTISVDDPSITSHGISSSVVLDETSDDSVKGTLESSLSNIPTKKTSTALGSALKVAPKEPFNPVKNLHLEPVPLPEETIPYLPPENLFTIPIKDIDDKGNAKPFKKKKDPNLEKIMEDLPKPQARLSLLSALTTVPDRPFTPDSFMQSINEQCETETSTNFSEMTTTEVVQTKKNELVKPTSLPVCLELQKQDDLTPSPECLPLFEGFTCSFQNKTDHSQFDIQISTTPPSKNKGSKKKSTENKNQIKSNIQKEDKEEEVSIEKISTCETKKTESTKIKETKSVEKKTENILFKKPEQMVSLRKPESLPQYQISVKENAEADIIMMKKREESEKRKREEKMKLDIEKTEAAKLTQVKEENKQQTEFSAEHSRMKPMKQSMECSYPTINLEQVQLGDENSFRPVCDNRSSTYTLSPRPRSITPSMVNKPPSLIPHYQANLVAQKHGPPIINLLSPRSPAMSRSPSPVPEHLRVVHNVSGKASSIRPKSPAQGPPLNPLQKTHIPTAQDFRAESAKEHVTAFIPQHKDKTDVRDKTQNMNTAGLIENSEQQVMYTAEISNRRDEIPMMTLDVESKTEEISSSSKDRMSKYSLEESRSKQTADSKKIETQSLIANVESTTKVCQTSHMEKSEGFKKMENQSVEKSSDGSIQIQRKKTITEEVEHTQKSQEIIVEKNVVGLHQQGFRNVKNVDEDLHHIMGLHVTAPNPIRSPFLKPHSVGCTPPKLTTVCQKVGKEVVPVKKEEISEIPEKVYPIFPKFDASILPQPKVIPDVPSNIIREIKSQEPPIKHIDAPGSSKSNRQLNPNIPPSDIGAGGGRQTGAIGTAPKRGRGVLNAAQLGGRMALCAQCHGQIRGPFITALGKIWCPNHFICATQSCRRPLQDLGFVEEHGQLYCEYCFEQYLAPACSKCGSKIKGDCLKAIGKAFHPECFNCVHCGKLFGNSPFFLEDGSPYCETDWNEFFTTKCFACGFPVEAGDRWVEALSNNYHSQCFNCTMCKKNLEGQSFFAKGGRPYCKNHAR